ncbi:hypothetical protein DKK70_07435 [Gilliamella apicola]|uniref:Uncharacterized protein n=1 Tax=Gilliamella apicola TaxID=1196095 RepID=A0A2V4E9P8_9GAMM|nr:hypothetical protein DKK70_07435 [Gilliamella apicola]
MPKIIKYLSKDKLWICLFWVSYLTFIITFDFFLLKIEFYISHIVPHICLIIFCIIIISEIVFFLIQLIKLFIIPQTHVLTSFLGLFCGLIFSFCWFGILYFYLEYVSNCYGDIGFIIALFIPAYGCFIGYIILVLIKILRCLCCFFLVKQANKSYP